MNPCALATDFAVRMEEAKTVQELELVRAEIRAHFLKDPAFKAEWVEWLEIGRDTAIERLSDKKPKESIFKDGLNCGER